MSLTHKNQPCAFIDCMCVAMHCKSGFSSAHSFMFQTLSWDTIGQAQAVAVRPCAGNHVSRVRTTQQLCIQHSRLHTFICWPDCENRKSLLRKDSWSFVCMADIRTVICRDHTQTLRRHVVQSSSCRQALVPGFGRWLDIRYSSDTRYNFS